MKILRALGEMLVRVPELIFGPRLTRGGPNEWERERLDALDAELGREGKPPVRE